MSQSGYYHRLRRLREAVCRQIGAEQEATQVPAQPAVVSVRKAETDARLLIEQEVKWLLEDLEPEQPKAIKPGKTGALY